MSPAEHDLLVAVIQACLTPTLWLWGLGIGWLTGFLVGAIGVRLWAH